MTTALMSAPTSLVGTAYAELAVELRALAATIAAGDLVSPRRAGTPPRALATSAVVPDSAPSSVLRSVAVTLRSFVLMFIVLPVVAFNVAIRLFPPVR